MLNYIEKYDNIIYHIGLNLRNDMEKYTCSLCNQLLDESFFYFRHHVKCKDCFNRQRRETNKKSICRYCKIEFRPDVQGKYRYCSIKCRFMAKVIKDGESGCWIWNGHITKHGYGSFVPEDGRKSALAHRESHRIFKGILDDNLSVMHSCDNTRCVNPEHLRLGTIKENKQDSIQKGRFTLDKLNEKQVLNIRRLYQEGTSIDILAKMYKRTPGTIMDIVYRFTWKEI